MNLAFPAIFFVLLISPGLLAVQAYFLGSKNSPTVRAGVGDTLVPALPVAALLHLVWSLCAHLGSITLGLPSVDVDTVLLLLASRSIDAELVAQATQHKAWTAIYFITLYPAAILVGRFLHRLIRSRRWDLKYPLLRFDTPWFYLFNGERTLFRENLAKRTEADFPDGTKPDETLVQAVVEHGNTAFLYSGWLSNFELNRSGDLDRIELAFAKRRPLQSEAAEAEASYYEIEGDHLIIDYRDVKDLNVQYRWYEELSG